MSAAPLPCLFAPHNLRVCCAGSDRTNMYRKEFSVPTATELHSAVLHVCGLFAFA